MEKQRQGNFNILFKVTKNNMTISIVGLVVILQNDGKNKIKFEVYLTIIF